jgi:hypothetical protein
MVNEESKLHETVTYLAASAIFGKRFLLIFVLFLHLPSTTKMKDETQ